MPFVSDVANTKVLVVGLGAVGAPVALELARAGVGNLTLVDHDVVDPGTVRRWTHGISAYGKKKVDIIANEISKEYPWTNVQKFEFKIGATRLPDQASHSSELRKLIDEADVVVDCCAELGVSHIISDIARIVGTTFVVANATPGAWGGIVARFRPDDVCWMCFRHALYGTSAYVPLPPSDPAGDVQPPGCADPTFTGAAFDLREVSLEAVRVVIGEISGGSYPPSQQQLAVLKLRNLDGSRIQPVWQPADINGELGCQCRGR